MIMKSHNALLATPLMALAAAACGNDTGTEKPNILLIVADDLGLGDLGAYGSTAIPTPNIDSLADNGINMEAFCIAETSDFGLMRLIVSEVDRTVSVLREAGFAVIVTDVVSISCRNVAGALASVLEILAGRGIFIEYMYAFSQKETADVIIKPDSLADCEKVIEELGLDNR